MKQNNFEQSIIKLILGAGILLSTIQYLYNRSLWLDEAYLALNIINKSHFDLLKPLDHRQVAPILFLQIEKIISYLIPNTEFGLRLFPLLSFWLSIFLFYKIIKTIHDNYYTIIFSLSIFIFNSYIIYYSNEVKQYITDTLVLTFLYYLVLKKYEDPKYKYYNIGLAGAICVFLSNVSPIILAATGLFLIHNHDVNDKKKNLYLLGISMVWSFSFLVYYYFFVYNHPTRDAMVYYWSSRFAFMPRNPLNLTFYKFIYDKWILIVTDLFKFGKIGGICISILILIGSMHLFAKKRIGLIILTIAPIILHLIISSLKLYPFSLRFIIYLCPVIIIICSFGFNYFINILSNDLGIKNLRILAIFIPILMFSFFCLKGFPLEHSEIKKSIKVIEQHINKSDTIYVNYVARIAFQYYREISFLRIDCNNIIIGNRYEDDPTNYINEVSGLSGRVWFIFSTKHRNEQSDVDILTRYFDSKNERLIQEFHTTGSSAYLYDLSARE